MLILQIIYFLLFHFLEFNFLILMFGMLFVDFSFMILDPWKSLSHFVGIPRMWLVGTIFFLLYRHLWSMFFLMVLKLAFIFHTYFFFSFQYLLSNFHTVLRLLDEVYPSQSEMVKPHYHVILMIFDGFQGAIRSWRFLNPICCQMNPWYFSTCIFFSEH